jgi:phenylacetate-coenzyme A ligase PaaK-like adenylate-forming protein
VPGAVLGAIAASPATTVSGRLRADGIRENPEQVKWTRADVFDFDGISPATHEAWLMNALRKQIGYMRAAVPHWSQRLSSARVDEEKIESLADLAALPIFTKAELRAEDVFSTAQQMRLFDFDTLVMPARTIRGKSVGIDTLLDQEPGLLERNKVRWWIGSSGTFGPEVVNQARVHGITAISNLYGSSEFAVFAISCAANPRDFHISRGYVLVEVVDEAGAPVRHGQFGRIVVTHLSGIDEHGNACVHRGTQILRLANGDGATLLSQPCECGLTSSRLTGIRRIVPTSE